ncbi:MAG: hypothetical protein JWM59_4063 [Verrucomicrobiales bacterium]|nr:hypothetical protein [Verrucomicrobiales bacterium]
MPAVLSQTGESDIRSCVAAATVRQNKSTCGGGAVRRNLPRCV